MELLEELRYLMLAVQRDGQRIYSSYLSPLGLTPAQAEVIHVLSQSQPLALIELGELLICEQGSPSRLVNGLVEAGLIAREVSTINRRKVVLTLTEQGEQLARQVAQIEKQLHQHLAQLGNREELEMLRRLLWRLEEEHPAGQALRRRLQQPEE